MYDVTSYSLFPFQEVMIFHLLLTPVPRCIRGSYSMFSGMNGGSDTKGKLSQNGRWTSQPIRPPSSKSDGISRGIVGGINPDGAYLAVCFVVAGGWLTMVLEFRTEPGDDAGWCKLKMRSTYRLLPLRDCAASCRRCSVIASDSRTRMSKYCRDCAECNVFKSSRAPAKAASISNSISLLANILKLSTSAEANVNALWMHIFCSSKSALWKSKQVWIR